VRDTWAELPGLPGDAASSSANAPVEITQVKADTSKILFM